MTKTPSPIVRVSVFLPREVYESLRERAFRSHDSVSALVRGAVSAALDGPKAMRELTPIAGRPKDFEVRSARHDGLPRELHDRIAEETADKTVSRDHR